ncbi:hypothetical protein D3C83_67700 [compost metagenome]
MKWPTKAAGALAPMNQNSTAPTANRIATDLAEAGSPAPPWPFFAAGAAAAGLAAAGGAAESFGAGGGQVMLPSFTTVVPRITSSSMLTSMTPSFFLHSSSASRNRLVA